ncbi:unnamed protein product [Vicia faba]|uniref:Retrotransposon Copia-like N-terminal domain-containing protein n=1 Tax=Vicia faba TaxID=3906 RepID=A0AAV1AY59_VICFA|nr:unnamed protein product [Vicia faba]
MTEHAYLDFAINPLNSYYIHPSENPTLILVTSLLDSKNYLSWARSMKIQHQTGNGRGSQPSSYRSRVETCFVKHGYPPDFQHRPKAPSINSISAETFTSSTTAPSVQDQCGQLISLLQQHLNNSTMQAQTPLESDINSIISSTEFVPENDWYS